jgi:hypothetical protein
MTTKTKQIDEECPCCKCKTTETTEKQKREVTIANKIGQKIHKILQDEGKLIPTDLDLRYILAASIAGNIAGLMKVYKDDSLVSYIEDMVTFFLEKDNMEVIEPILVVPPSKFNSIN